MRGYLSRMLGTDPDERQRMCSEIGVQDAAHLMEQAMPAIIRQGGVPRVEGGWDEEQVVGALRQIATRNRIMTSMIGQGYYDTITPQVLQRNVLENPAWYTAYTPYQPEISQGRLEVLFTFQTLISDLTGLPVAGASLLDEATAAAEAMTLASRVGKNLPHRFAIDADVLPATRAVLQTRAAALGIELVDVDMATAQEMDDIQGFLVQYPGASGRVPDLVEARRLAASGLLVVAAEPLALTLLRSPGDAGADVCVGSTQRFGLPMAFGGPHAAFMAVRTGLERQLPGRLVGLSHDADGAPAYRLALQTREQHIRREKATSNICTAQVLPAIVATLYAMWHGIDGLRAIATRIHDHACAVADSALRAGAVLENDQFFDTVRLKVPGQAAAVAEAARTRGINIHVVDADTVGVSCDERTTPLVVSALAAAIAEGMGVTPADATNSATPVDRLPEQLLREDQVLTHPVFLAYRTETSMMRYLRALADKDYALDRGMIPLGSCTMKLNPAVAMAAMTWPEFCRIHPFAPEDDVRGYHDLIYQLESDLAALTGYEAASIQPNAGSQGELAGLLAIRGYHAARGEQQRDICLIPASAHGTNAASAVLAGLRVVTVSCDDTGAVRLDDLDRLLDEHRGRIAAIMVTYPSTYGIYEEGIGAVCEAVHDAGGQVYVDGANLNALAGLARPGAFGGDVTHVNLHKTFAIPHGGGGPGVGPVVAHAHLEPFLPGHPQAQWGRREHPVAGAPFGSAGILAISWAYLRLLGSEGLVEVTRAAVVAANYLAARLARHYPVRYTGAAGRVAHECIVDVAAVLEGTGLTVDDVAKRLIDYGFHAPTMSFPIAGTFMVEPTEAESLAEMDRFADAMSAIAAEIEQVRSGTWPRDDNPLTGAPHTVASVVGEWEHPYSRQEAVFPAGVSAGAPAYVVPVRRIDGAYGDRHLVCRLTNPIAPDGAVATEEPVEQSSDTPPGSGEEAARKPEG